MHAATNPKTVARAVLTTLMVTIGALHFTMAGFFVRIVPPYLPHPRALVAVSGVFEILGGIGLLVPISRRFSSIGLIALYLAVFPANLNMALHPAQFAEFPPAALWLRLPFQAVLIVWVWWVGIKPTPPA